MSFEAALNKYFDSKQDSRALDVLYREAKACGQVDHQIMLDIMTRSNVKQLLANKGIVWARAELDKCGHDIKGSDDKVLEIAENIFSIRGCLENKGNYMTSMASSVSAAVVKFVRVLASVQEKIQLQTAASAPIGDVQKIHITGDGHCLFRSFAYGLIRQSKAKQPTKQALIDLLNEKKSQASPALKAAFPKFESSVNKLIQAINDGRPVLEIINEEKLSDELVEALRVISCALNSQKQVFIDMMPAQADRDEYFNNMMAMNQRRHGGQEEFTALSDFFRVNIYSFNFTSNEISYATPGQQLVPGQQVSVSLHFNPGHYNALELTEAQEATVRGMRRGQESAAFKVV